MNVPIRDIPQSLLDDIDSNLRHYFLPISGRDEQRSTEPFRLIGSGTFVSIRSDHYILTAAHVWDATRGFRKIDLFLDSPRSCLSIPREYIYASAPQLWGTDSESIGPDLALLAIPPNIASYIRAYKSALDLVQQRNAFLADPSTPQSALWAVIGLEAISSTVRPDLAERTIQVKCQVHSYVGGIDATFERQGYDYLDVGADARLPAVPPSFGGLSGGALWQIDLRMNGTGEIYWNGQKHFHGVAFSEWDIREGRRIVRCHGRKSLFETAWSEWRLPR